MIENFSRPLKIYLKILMPEKGFDLPSFGNSFSLNKITIVIEYTGFANFE